MEIVAANVNNDGAEEREEAQITPLAMIVESLRIARGMTLAELAAATGLSLPYLNKFKTTPSPGLVSCIKIAKALNISLDAMAGLDDAEQLNVAPTAYFRRLFGINKGENINVLLAVGRALAQQEAGKPPSDSAKPGKRKQEPFGGLIEELLTETANPASEEAILLQGLRRDARQLSIEELRTVAALVKQFANKLVYLLSFRRTLV